MASAGNGVVFDAGSFLAICRDERGCARPARPIHATQACAWRATEIGGPTPAAESLAQKARPAPAVRPIALRAFFIIARITRVARCPITLRSELRWAPPAGRAHLELMQSLDPTGPPFRLNLDPIHLSDHAPRYLTRPPLGQSQRSRGQNARCGANAPISH